VTPPEHSFFVPKSTKVSRALAFVDEGVRNEYLPFVNTDHLDHFMKSIDCVEKKAYIFAGDVYNTIFFEVLDMNLFYSILCISDYFFYN
jgi:hypothetical protein